MRITSLYRWMLRWAFRRFYNEFAWTYDLVAALVSGGLWSRWIEAAVPLVHGERVLELACGTGYLQRALIRQQISTVGLDGSAFMLRHTQRKLAHAGLQAPLVQAFAQYLPFLDASFSDIVATFPAEYILDPVTHAEAWRVLQPGGQIVLIDGAQFMHRTPYTTAIDLAYRATGQTQRDDPRAVLLHQAGFVVRERWVVVNDSWVQALIGWKGDAVNT